MSTKVLDLEKLSVRKAGLDDLDLLIEIRMEVLQSVFELSIGHNMPDLIQANRRYFEKSLSDDSCVTYLAFHNKKFAACASLCLYELLPSPDDPHGICACLMNVYTRPDFRGNGIARHLVNHLLCFAQKSGVNRVFLEATQKGMSLYESLGFVTNSDHRQKIL